MKFRYLVNSAMLWTALALGSCADFLDREPYSEPVDESYWNSEEDVEAAVAGGIVQHLRVVAGTGKGCPVG